MTGYRATALLAVCLLLVAACGTSGASPVASPTAAATVAASATPGPAPTPSFVAPSLAAGTLRMVVIGDSIPFGGHFCPGCTAFPDLYGKDITAKTGHAVSVANRSRDDGAQMDQVALQVKYEGQLRAELAAADIVLVSIGFNNLLPDPGSWSACTGDMGSSIETYVDWALANGSACLKAGLPDFAERYDRLFTTITDLRAGKPTVYAVINVHAANIGGSDFASIPAAKMARMNAWMVDVYTQWNTMECERGKAHGFACVDVYHAFNGPKGDKPSGLVNTIDGAHPSQAGNNLIASLLAQVDISAIAR